ncbi:MAG: hypothetical protein WBB34_09610 [Xanthobacteraceae bacterium]
MIADDDVVADRESVLTERKIQEQSMRRTLRKSIPYLFALLAGTLAGACVAGFALFASHS